MIYLLDTCVISDFVKGDVVTLARLRGVSPSDIAISSITVMELQYGLNLNPAKTIHIKKPLHDFLSVITVLDFNQEDAREAAMIRAILKQQGNLIGAYDLLLAGMALSRKLIMVTSNKKEFSRVEGIKLENWREKGV